TAPHLGQVSIVIFQRLPSFTTIRAPALSVCASPPIFSCLLHFLCGSYIEFVISVPTIITLHSYGTYHFNCHLSAPPSNMFHLACLFANFYKKHRHLILFY